MDQFNDIILKNQNIEAHRQCGNGKKTYEFSNIKMKYPEFIHYELQKVWKNPEIEFYSDCSRKHFPSGK